MGNNTNREDAVKPNPFTQAIEAKSNPFSKFIESDLESKQTTAPKVNPFSTRIEEDMPIAHTQATSTTEMDFDSYKDFFGEGQVFRPTDIAGLNEARAQAQSGVGLIGKGLLNTVSGMVGGTAEGIGYLADVEQWVNLAQGTEKEFGNWFSDWAKKTTEELSLPVYRTKESQGFAPWTQTWWADNGPSIGSALSLLIPTTAAVKGLGAIGKAAGGLRAIEALGMGAAEVNALKGITGAVVSRYMENTMEASQTFNDLYSEAIKLGKPEDEARNIAASGASNTWYANTANLMFDIPQYMLAFRGFNFSKAASKTAGALSKIPGGELLAQATGEALEEAGQYTVQEEAKRSAKIEGGLMKDDNSTFVDRLGEYAKNGDFWTSAVFGALGGGLFHAGSKVNQKIIDGKQAAQQTLVRSILEKQRAAITGDKDSFDKSSDEDFARTAIIHAQQGRLEDFEKDLKNLRTLSQDDIVSSGFDKEDFHAKIAQRLEDVKFIEDTNNRIQNQIGKSPELKNTELAYTVGQRLTERRISTLKRDLQILKNEDAVSTNLNFELAALKENIFRYQALPKDSTEAKRLEALIDKQIETIKNDDNLYPEFTSKQSILEGLRTSNDAIYAAKVAALVESELDLTALKDNIDKLNTKSGVQEFETKLAEERKAEEAKQKKAEKEANDAIEAQKAAALKAEDEAKRQADIQKTEAIKAEQERQATLKVDDDVIWKSKDADIPVGKITGFSDDRKFVNVSGTKTGIPINELFTSEDPINSITAESDEDTQPSETEAKVTKAPTEPDGRPNTLTRKEREDIKNFLKSDISGDDGQKAPDGHIVTMGELIVPAASSFAYLTRQYTEQYSKVGKSHVRVLRNADNELNKEMQEPLLLSSEQYQVGEEVTLEVDKTFSMTIGEGENKITVDYNQLKDDFLRVPIKIVGREGKTIAYLHDIDWITEKNVARTKDGDNVEIQRDILTKLRAKIFNEGAQTTTIESKSYGKLLEPTDDTKLTTAEAFPDSSLPIVIGKRGTIYESLDTPVTGEMPVNKQYMNGVTYTIVPTPVAGKTVAVYLNQTKVSTEIADSLANASEAFLTQDKELAGKIEDITGIDILTTSGLRKYFNLFVYTDSFDQSILSQKDNLGRDDKLFVDIAGANIKYGVGGGTMRDVGNLNYWNREDFINHIKNAYVAIFLSRLQNGTYKYPLISNDKTIVNREEPTYKDFIRKYTTADLLSFKLPDDTYAYFGQPVITFDFDKILGTSQSTNPETEVTEEPTAEEQKALKDFGFGELDEESFNLEDELPLPQEITDKILESSYLIKGFTAEQQNEVVNILNSYILKRLKAEKRVSKETLYSDAKSVFAKYKKLAKTDALKAEFEKILANYDKFIELSEMKRDKLGIVKETNIQDTVSTELTDAESDHQKVSYDDQAVFSIDSKETMSGRLKTFFSFIQDTKKSYLGLPKYVPFDEITDYLSGQLANTEPDYATIRQNIEEAVESRPYLNNVLKALDETDNQVRNEFVQWATKHYTPFKIAMWITGPVTSWDHEQQRYTKDYDEDGKPKKNYTLKVIDANQNSVQKTILSSWENSLKQSKLIKESETGEVIINSVYSKELIEESKTLDKSSNDQIRNWLSKMGIDISKRTIEEIRQSSTRKGGLTMEQQFTDPTGIFKTIIDRLKSSEKVKEETDEDVLFSLNNPLYNNSGINKLARMEAKNTIQHFSNSHRSGDNKTVYSYTQNKYLTNRVRDLKVNKNGLVDNLKKISFSSNSRWLEQLSKGGWEADTFNFFYTDSLKQQNSAQGGKRLQDQTDREHELLKVSMFMNQVNGRQPKGEDIQRMSHFLFLTCSDKTTAPGITAVAHNTKVEFSETGDIKLKKETINELYKIVESEFLRIRNYQNREGKPNIAGYEGDKFIFFEPLNAKFRPELWNNGQLRPATSTITIDGKEQTIGDYLKEYVHNYTLDLIKEKLSEWETYGFIEKTASSTKIKYMDKTYLKKFAEEQIPKSLRSEDNKASYAAADYVVNYMIANANMFQIIVGDPALFWKKNHSETWINIGKRLAAEIAPGLELADANQNNYKQLYIDDRKSISLYIDQIEKILGANVAKPYREIEAADAQEYSTLSEHLYVMFKSGKLSEENYIAFRTKARHNSLFAKEELQALFQPTKPVYVNQIIDLENDVAQKVYIKSSSFPLVPQITKGTELDKLRVYMEDNNVSRAAHKSAVKVGGPRKFAKVWKDDGTFDDTQITPDHIMSLNRSGFRIQQDVPYDPDKTEITRGTQETKLIFLNILNKKGFSFNGEKMKGEQLKELYTKAYMQLFEQSKKELLENKLHVRERGNDTYEFQTTALQEMLKEEAIGRGYPLNDQLALELTKIDENTETFTLPLWASTSSNKFESLLTSIVDNGIRKQKLRGNSFVLGSEEGITIEGLSYEDIKKGVSEQQLKEFLDTYKGDIIFTDKFKGQLAPMGENGEPAQVMMPNRIRDHKGNLIDLRDYLTSEGLVNFERLPEELTKMFAFRIPTQGHNSMAPIQVVGFLPEYMGDLIIAPRDFTKQMGSDFDIDKLYVYLYNAEFKDNKLSKTDSNGDSREALQNRILDIHFSIMSHPEVIKDILQPLDEGELGTLAKKVNDARLERGLIKQLKPLSDSYQREKYVKGKVSALGRAIKVLDSTFGALLQKGDKEGNDIILRTIDEEGKQKQLVIVFGDNNEIRTGDEGEVKTKNLGNNLSYELAQDGQPKSRVHSAYISVMVDNEKLQIAEKINSNGETFAAERTLALTGYTEQTITPFIAQDIIFEYTDKLKSSRDSINEAFTKDAKGKVESELRDKYLSLAGLDPALYVPNPDYPLTRAEMWGAIEKGIDYPDYAKIQLYTLEKFIKAREIGDILKRIQSAVDTDSSGLGKSLLETNEKEKKVYQLAENAVVANASTLIGIFDNEDGTIIPTTINGVATTAALFPNNRLWRGLYPYQTTTVRQVLDEVQRISNRQFVDTDAQRAVFDGIKSYLFTRKENGLSRDPQADRERLFFDKTSLFIDKTGVQQISAWPNKSLAKRIEDFKLTKTGKANAFIVRLATEVDITGKKPSIIKYQASANENLEELNIYQGFADLFRTSEGKEIAEDLIRYFYLSGGEQKAIQFGKYIPISYLTNTNFAKDLREVDFELDSTLSVKPRTSYYSVSGFTRQYIQNNPNIAMKASDDYSQFKNIKKDDKGLVTSMVIDTDRAKDLLVTRINSDGSVINEANPEFISIFDYTSSKRFRLYEYTGDGQYNLIDTLGSFGMTEYDAQSSDLRSLIESNRAPRKIVKGKPDNITGDNRDSIQRVKGDLTNPTPTENLFASYGLDGEGEGHEKITNALNKIASDSTNYAHQALAETFLHLKQTDDLKSITIKKATRGVSGLYDYGDRTIYINPKLSKLEFEKTLLHEYIHHLTGHILYAPDRKLSAKQLAIRESIERLQEVLKAKIAKDPKSKKEYQDTLKTIRDKGALTEDQISKYYGASKTTEFVAMLMTDKGFQKFLNDIPFSQEKSFWNRFVDLIIKALETLGFDVKKDSVLENGIKNTIELINNRDINFQAEGSDVLPMVQTEAQQNLLTWLQMSNLVNKATFHNFYTLKLGKQGTLEANYRAQRLSEVKTAIKKFNEKEGYESVTIEPWGDMGAYKVEFHPPVDYLVAAPMTSKYQKLIDFKQEQIKDLKTSLARHKENKEYEARIGALINTLEAQLEQLIAEDRLGSVIIAGENDMKAVNELLKQSTLAPSDIDHLNRTITFWEQALPIIFTKEDLVKVDGKSSPNVEAIKTIIAEANDARVRFTDVFNKVAVELMQRDDKSITEETITAPLPDINTLSANMLDISRIGDKVSSYIHGKIKQASFRTHTEMKEVMDNLDELYSDLKEHELFKKNKFDIFAQFDAQGKKTGNMADRFSDSYYKESRKQIFIARKVNTKQGWSNYWSWKRANTIVFDLRKLLYDQYQEIELNPTTYTKAEIQAHKDELIKQLGEKGFEFYNSRITKKFEEYKGLLEAEKTRIESLEADGAEKASMLHEFEIRNSPFNYAKYTEEASSPKIGDKFIAPQGWKYTYSVPRKFNAQGETGFYDKNFSVIENDETLNAYYEFVIDTLNKMYGYLPDYYTDDLSYNTIPEVKKTVAQLFSEKGSMSALKGWYDSFIEDITIDELSQKAEYDALTGEVKRKLPVTMLSKSMEPEDKSYDLNTVTRAFALMAISYKHKSAVEDSIRIAEQVMRNRAELMTNADGKPLLDKFNRPIISEKGLRNVLDQLDYAVDAFYGKHKRIQAITGTKLKLKGRISELNEKLKEGHDLTFDQVEAIQEEITKLELGQNVHVSGIIDKINAFTQLKFMGWNPFAPANNTIFSFVSNLIHASRGDDFNINDLLKAKQRMLSSVVKSATLDQYESATAKKVRALMEKLNVVGEIHPNSYGDFANSSRASKGIEVLSPFELTKRAEYLNQGTTFMALLEAKKVKDKEGVEHSYWDAHDENGEWKTEQFGEKPNWEEKFKAKFDQIKKSIHGNYDPDSATRISKGMFGRSLMLFRRWVAEGYANRFESEKYDTVLERNRKGRYVSLFSSTTTGGDKTGALHNFKLVLKQMLNFMSLNGVMKDSLNHLSPTDKANLRANAMEALVYMNIFLLILALKAMDTDDEEEYAMVNYLFTVGLRVQNDMAFFTSPMAFETITRSSIPAAQSITDAWAFGDAMIETVEGKGDYKSGPHKGESKAIVKFAKFFPATNVPVKITNTLDAADKQR